VYASPIGVNNRVYVAGLDGTSLVLEKSRELKILASNKLDDAFAALRRSSPTSYSSAAAVTCMASRRIIEACFPAMDAGGRVAVASEAQPRPIEL
jgi:hypothetical protein